MSAMDQNMAETRKLAMDLLMIGEKILALLAQRDPETAAPRGGIDTEIKIRLVRKIVAAHFGFSDEQVLKRDRRSTIVWVRMVAMFMCKEVLKVEDRAIEDSFRRTHGCLDNAMRMVKNRCEVETADGRMCREDVLSLRAKIMANPNLQ